jgi:hypothetical protein
MNIYTKEIMKMLEIDETEAEEVLERVEESNLDLSECTDAEFRRAVFLVFKQRRSR